MSVPARDPQGRKSTSPRAGVPGRIMRPVRTAGVKPAHDAPPRYRFVRRAGSARGGGGSAKADLLDECAIAWAPKRRDSCLSTPGHRMMHLANTTDTPPSTRSRMAHTRLRRLHRKRGGAFASETSIAPKSWQVRTMSQGGGDGTDHLVFGGLKPRTTILEIAGSVNDDQAVEMVGSTGIGAKTGDAQIFNGNQTARNKRQRFSTGLSGGYRHPVSFSHHGNRGGRHVAAPLGRWPDSDTDRRDRPVKSGGRFRRPARRADGMGRDAQALARDEPAGDRRGCRNHRARCEVDPARVASFVVLSSLEMRSASRALAMRLRRCRIPHPRRRGSSMAIGPR